MTTDLDHIATTVQGFDWTALYHALDDQGFVILPKLLDGTTCQTVASAYEQDALFRNRVIMEKHAYGRGEYRYFAYPLPDVVATLRAALYGHLAAKANDWMAKLKKEIAFPAELPTFLERCHAAGQKRPTPLLLRYAAGDFNCLHRDLYGAEVFPLQVAILLSRPQKDFTGGELIMTEQRPRMQSRVRVVPLGQGDAVIFAVADRPALSLSASKAAPRYHRVQHRHGVATLASGSRSTLGIIFHDAE